MGSLPPKASGGGKGGRGGGEGDFAARGGDGLQDEGTGTELPMRNVWLKPVA